MTMKTTAPKDRAPQDEPARLSSTAQGFTRNLNTGLGAMLVKILAIAVLDATALFAVFLAVAKDALLIASIIAVITLVINAIYFKRGWLPAKYLAPGAVFLLIFQVFVIGYTGYIAFTNYGSGHNSDKDDAIMSLLQSNQQRVPESAGYPVTVLEGADGLALLVEREGQSLMGDVQHPLAPIDPDALGQYTQLSFADLLGRQQEVTSLAVPMSENPADGTLRTSDGRTAYQYTSTLVYEPNADTMTDSTTGLVYRDTGVGAYSAPSGEQLMPGWSINVGFDNFTRAVTDSSIRGSLISVTAWTFGFAFLSVATSFFLGLFLAIVFNDLRMKGRKVYRVISILPYAFPAFLGGLVWAGMLNKDFGYVNQVLFGGASIPWLTDPWLAKFSVLWVNLWLGFPYMFLVCTGALQSIPDELAEAAKIDGAKPWQIFRLIKLPLLLVSVAPLLISSFAFNFNNFNVIYMLTEGGPRLADSGMNVGATDILISMVYKVAFVGSQRDYGLASAFSIIIFLIVSLVAVISFKQTKALEELN
ncbi:maltose ABC transporter permease [Arthrobacter sp. MYb211]|uniref:ABC transporter permease subunit n=1 Tax=Micrococcaceae TaxID=1268 RepID=UPI000CFC920A|nr:MULTISPECIES: ABC transporter permease subunit [unclassified Arthrobacter]PRA08256.1 maltose ABC transporter permease [Arthrobacter sp. MYb221]PRC02870.1 maltose ABC transporter permease [Arthrobacter sp. MYb211]